MKKVISTMLAVTVFGAAASAAAPTVSLNMNTDKFIVKGSLESGTEGKTVKLIVLNPNKKIEDIKSDNYKDTVQIVLDCETESNGAYSFDVPVYKAAVGDYSFYIQTDESEMPVMLTHYYADSDTVKQIIADINGAEKADMGEKLENAVKPLNLIGGIFDEIKPKDIGEFVYDFVSKNKLNENDPDSAAAELRCAALLYAYNNGMNEICFNADGSFKYTDIYDLTQSDKNGITLYSVYSTLINSKGKQEIQNGLMNKDFKTADELQNEFRKLVFTKSINNSAKDGTGHIKSILTDKNAESTGVSVSKYTALPNGTVKSNIEYKLMQKSYNTPELLVSDLNKFIDSYGGGQNGGGNCGNNGNNGNNGNSIKGGGVGSDSGIIAMENKPIHENNTDGFTDIENVQWAKEAIMYLYNKNIINGVGDGRFAPSDTVTREQFAVMLVNAMNIELSDGKSSFDDVPDGSYYAKHVFAAERNNIVSGIGENIFGVGMPITRQDLCVMIYRAVYKEDDEANEMYFSDSAQISGYANSAVNHLAELGIINGFEDGSFAPKQLCTRAEAAKILFGVLNNSK